MIKRIAQILIIVFTAQSLYAQKSIKLNFDKAKQSNRNIEQVRNKANGFIIAESIATIDLVEKNTKEGIYGQLVSEGMSKTYDEGNPDLPVFNRLIDIPVNSEVSIKVLSYDEEIIDLNNKSFTKQLIPAQPSYEKSKELKDVPFIKNKEVYKKNEFFKKELVRFEDKGYLRDKHLGYLEISPFMYNPVSNVLKVLNNIEIEVTFIPSNKGVVINKGNLKSSYFNSLNYNVINKSADTKALTEGPVKYVIISDRMFEETLQDFILWKTQKGFHVVVAYTDEIGTTTTEIKSYLQDLYENPSDGISPTFVLLVGDVAQIPTFDGNAGSHKTDLYYCEYTGDKLPEVFYGRFSAESIEELQPQIDKTLEIEKYEMPDPSYLDNVVLVAGVDGSNAPTYGNGAINYANDNYTNSENGITSYYYLYGDDSGVMASNNSGASESIRSYISAGVSFTNYTAHCGVSGWSDPSFNTGHIDGLTNDHMYPLVIGNCCQSNTFNSDDCFGEEMLMAANKGAVGYIGGSDYTYWDEDYYWGVGLTSSITANPSYENSGLGAYDRFFHLNGEAKDDWYITQGQINVAGNLAVEASTSSRKAYYWEIYHLMGDPSLTPYVTVPSVLVASYNNEIIIGATTFDVTAEENAYVAISKDGVLLDAKLVGESGEVTLTFSSLDEVGNLDLVVTKQNRQPIIDQVSVIPSTSPYVLLDEYSINDVAENNNSEVDYGETIKLDVQLNNLSDSYDAYNVDAKLISTDTNIVIVDSTEDFGTILRSAFKKINESYTIEFKNKFNDQQDVNFILEISCEDSEGKGYMWDSKIDLTVNAPKISMEYLYVDDVNGDNDSLVDPGEEANVFIKITNEGSARIENLTTQMELLRGSSNIDLISDVINNLNLDSNTSDTLQFSLSVSQDEIDGSFADLLFTLEDNENNFYGDSLIEELQIGDLEEYKIDTLANVSVETQLLFYDSGGKDEAYTNYENDTITFYPANPRGKLEIEFYSFGVEPNGGGCYDYLEIYDGENTDATIVDSYCDSNKPTKYLATNDKGALTFRFYSDQSVVEEGWEAKISNTGNFVKFIVNDENGVVENAIVEFDNEEKYTNEKGIANFYYVTDGENLNYVVRKDDYDNLSGDLNIDRDTTINLSITGGIPKFKVTFNVSHESEPVYNALVALSNDTAYTNVDGIAVFDDIFEDNNIPFSISKTHFNDIIGTLDVKGDNVLVDTALTYKSYQIDFNVSDGEYPVDSANVEFNKETKFTNSEGICSFNVKYSLNKEFKISKDGYKIDSGMINVDENKAIDVTLDKTYQVKFIIVDYNGNVEDALVEFNSQKKYTDIDGEAIFTDISKGENLSYSVSKDRYERIDSVLSVSGNVTENVDFEFLGYIVTFNIKQGNVKLPDATINFNSEEKTTNSQGEAMFEGVIPSNIDYTITKTGYDDLRGTAQIESNDTTLNLQLSISTGIKKLDSDQLKIYPNPSNGQFTVEINNISGTRINIKIFNIIGSSFYTKQFSGESFIQEQIDLSQYAKGFYFISVESDNGMLVNKRIIIK